MLPPSGYFLQQQLRLTLQRARRSAIDSCTIITGDPNELAAKVHDRMPVILRPEDYDRWLDPKNTDAEELQALLLPYPAEDMAMRPVSTRVNSPRNDDPDASRG